VTTAKTRHVGRKRNCFARVIQVLSDPIQMA
jgi:hypothetical protein